MSALLGAIPTSAQTKGQVIVGRTGVARIANSGSWRLESTKREPEDLEAQVFELLDQLTLDCGVWASLGSRFRVGLFCGVFMGSFNDGLVLSPKALLALGQRSIKLELDIYDASRD
ncbi:DUF4279 domain-containing protein [Diaphorobacter sp. HDW4B]|uniref:DUF4279 domain-containing protein n=1 Tax=Diaphorobacter sp. HDW4B TaxID=2714925 RepID=UPI00352C9F9E